MIHYKVQYCFTQVKCAVRMRYSIDSVPGLHLYSQPYQAGVFVSNGYFFYILTFKNSNNKIDNCMLIYIFEMLIIKNSSPKYAVNK